MKLKSKLNSEKLSRSIFIIQERDQANKFKRPTNLLSIIRMYTRVHANTLLRNLLSELSFFLTS
jgi:hypothetical protein